MSNDKDDQVIKCIGARLNSLWGVPLRSCLILVIERDQYLEQLPLSSNDVINVFFVDQDSNHAIIIETKDGIKYVLPSSNNDNSEVAKDFYNEIQEWKQDPDKFNRKLLNPPSWYEENEHNKKKIDAWKKESGKIIDELESKGNFKLSEVLILVTAKGLDNDNKKIEQTSEVTFPIRELFPRNIYFKKITSLTSRLVRW